MYKTLSWTFAAALTAACSNDAFVGDAGEGDAGGGGPREEAGQTAQGGSAGAPGSERVQPTGSGAAGTESSGGWRFESIAQRKASYAPSSELWVVNAAVSGTSSGEVYVAGYVSGATARPPGFVDRIVGDDYEVVLEQPAWNWGLWAASAEVAFTACGSLVRVQGGQPTVEFAVEGPDDSLMDVWGFADDEVVAVGGGGLIVHSVGGVATVEESGTAAGLSGVWGTDPEHVVAVGDSGVILTRSQGTWTSVPSGTNVDLNDVWGSSADDVIAVGGSETVPGHVILHFDGESWSTVHAGDARKSTVLGISGTSSSDSVAVGAYRDDAGTPHAEIFHFDGQSWVEIPNSIDKFLWSVWCSSPGDCYVGGPDDTLVHMTRVE